MALSRLRLPLVCKQHLSLFPSILTVNKQLQNVPTSPFGSSCCGDHNHNHNTPKRKNTLVNFSLSDQDSDSELESSKHEQQNTKTVTLPPPTYDPFDKKSTTDNNNDDVDPRNLQEVFHKMGREGGLMNSAVKMFDGLSKQGLTHEALELFSQIKDKGQMPDVVAHTAVIEAYANAGQSKEVLKTYNRMLACGVLPNAYTYTILITSFAADSKLLPRAKSYVLEMMEKGMRPNAATYTAVLEAFVREKKLDEASKLIQQMKAKGLQLDEKAVREFLHSKRVSVPVSRTLTNLLFHH